MSSSVMVPVEAATPPAPAESGCSTGRQVFVVCNGQSCRDAGANRLLGLLRRQCQHHHGGPDVRISESKCLGHCALAPTVINNGRVLGWVSLSRLKSELSRLGLFSMAEPSSTHV